MKNWTIFLLSLGFLLIALSPTVEFSASLMTSGIVLVVGSAYMLYRKRGK
ncbi:hypothetical protein DES51_101236 [Dielma fastidiosa]|uniref:Uncharacterized protein n=1 Tax=Dielma fastidiosa TaxID=1034346 RepID=A0A318L102_9FIRM|nr:hypothetical protein DES51_101236 [Dielma fastidiosa]